MQIIGFSVKSLFTERHIHGASFGWGAFFHFYNFPVCRAKFSHIMLSSSKISMISSVTLATQFGSCSCRKRLTWHQQLRYKYFPGGRKIWPLTCHFFHYNKLNCFKLLSAHSERHVSLVVHQKISILCLDRCAVCWTSGVWCCLSACLGLSVRLELVSITLTILVQSLHFLLSSCRQRAGWCSWIKQHKNHKHSNSSYEIINKYV